MKFQKVNLKEVEEILDKNDEFLKKKKKLSVKKRVQLKNLENPLLQK